MDKVRNYVGLYYPYIHFRDEAWLKSTLLYWDRMRRIVPEADVDQAQRGDSATVRQLEAEGFVEDVIPVQQMNALGKDFLQLIERHGDQLVKRYGIVAPSTRGVERRGQIAERWQGTRPRPGANPALSYVYYGKLSPRLASALVAAGMATSPDDMETLGIHPQLAAVYLTALAESVARATGSHPLTHEPMAHVAVTGVSLDRLAAALLPEAPLAVPERPDVEVPQEMMSLAFRAVLPKGVADIPVNELIRFWKKRAGERAEFQTSIEELATGLEQSLSEVQDIHEIRRHIEILYEKTLGSQLSMLERDLRGVGIDTVAGVAAASVPLAGAGASAVATGSETGLILAVAGLAVSGWKVLREHKRRRVPKASPASYLHYVKADLGPRGLASRVARTGARLIGRSA
jgi:hypothetical protein